MDKRHFTVVIGSKEHGLYVSSKPSSAAKKAVSKLCASNKSKKVEFSLREITQGSKKKTYGPYLGEMKKLKKPIELKGRIIRHKIKLYLKKGKRSTIKTAKKMRGGEGAENISVIIQRIRGFKKQLSDLIEMKNFQGILDAIFNGNVELISMLDFSNTNEKFIKEMIDHINLLPSNENKNKYFFIILYIIGSRDSDDTIFGHLITIIGLDRLIEILYRTNYETVFDRIIDNIETNTIIGINQISIKVNVFRKLLNIYYEEMSLDEFKQLLIKLFSIQDTSFINWSLLENLFLFFTNKYSKKQSSFKLLDFLLENKDQLKDFIRIFKSKFEPRSRDRFLISPKIRQIIGTEEKQAALFSNV